MMHARTLCAFALVTAATTNSAVAGDSILLKKSFPIASGAAGQSASAAIVFGLDEPGTLLGDSDPTFLFDNFFWTNPGQGATIVVDQSIDADFDHVTGLLTNGSNDRMWVGTVYSGGGQSLGGAPESVYLFPGASNVDFLGYEIHRIALTLDEFSIEVPGANPNGDGDWTNVNALATLTVYGVAVPEPGSAALLAVGGSILALYARRCRKAAAAKSTSSGQ